VYNVSVRFPTMSEYILSAPETSEIWQQACVELQLDLSPAVFNTWVLNNPVTEIALIGDDKASCTITSPTAFHSTNLKKNLGNKLETVLSKLLGRSSSLVFKIGTPVFHDTSSQQSSQQNNTNSGQNSPQASQNQNPAYMQPATFHKVDSDNNSRSTDGGSRDSQGTHGSQSSYDSSRYSNQRSHQSSQQYQQNNQQNNNNSQQGYQQQNQQSNPSSVPNGFSSQSRPSYSNSPRVEDLFSQSSIQNATVDRAKVAAQTAGLRADYTFDTFAVSGTNEMAHAAATAVSQRPGTAYNPLFLYGGVGVGKTHLMHALAHNILQTEPTTKIIYCSGEEFTNEIVSAIQTKKALRFKDKYRNAQVLLIDDIQFIAGKNTVQEEFFHTFNALTQQARQIVLTSDRPPHEINLLEDRLRSRFEAGLMVDIQQPSFELRTAILLIKAKASNVTFSMEIAQLIASKVDSARKIEGLIKRLKSAVELQKKEVSIELVEDILSAENSQEKTKLKVAPNDIIRAVANHFHVKQTALRGKKRVASLVKARHVAMYLLKEELHMPLTEIGRWFSNRDHTSALHATRKIEKEMKLDSILQRDVSALRMSLSAISK
jgi:chromosomal replication initiator protein